MGAPIAYECRREELAALDHHSPAPAAVDSSNVSTPTTVTATGTGSTSLLPWQSFIQSTHPSDGLLTRYLELGTIAAVVENVLFVHGALHEHNMG